jgi:hypothetical protein
MEEKEFLSVEIQILSIIEINLMLELVNSAMV